MAGGVAERISATVGRKRTQGPRVVRFIEGYCCHPDGPLVGQPLTVHPFWRQRIYELFALRPRRCSQCGEIAAFTALGTEADDGVQCSVCHAELEAAPPDQRQYSEALIGVPKKNAKTTISAGLGLYMLVADGDPSSLVVSAAASEEQGANLLFGSAKTMCKLSAPLREVCEAYESEILVPSLPRARMRNVTSAAGTNDGLNIKCLICDELHEWRGERGRNVHTVLSNGTGARPESMIVQITTAGFDTESLCYEKYEYGKRVRSGEIQDDAFYFYWLEPDPADDYRDPSTWRKVNPLLGESVREDYLADQVKRKRESVVRRYNLNQWVSGEDIWMSEEKWDACVSDVELDPTLPVSVGIDCGLKHDSSACTLAQKQPGRIVVRTRIWENPYPETHELHSSWRFPLGELEAYLLELHEAYPVAACEIDKRAVPGPQYLYDPHFFEDVAQRLSGEGLAMVEYPQTDSRMIPASQGLYDLVQEGKLAHDGDPALRRHAMNATADPKPRGWRLSKPHGSRRKIDGVIAAAIAVWGASNTTPPVVRRSVYERRGVLVI